MKRIRIRVIRAAPACVLELSDRHIHRLAILMAYQEIAGRWLRGSAANKDELRGVSSAIGDVRKYQAGRRTGVLTNGTRGGYHKISRLVKFHT